MKKSIALALAITSVFSIGNTYSYASDNITTYISEEKNTIKRNENNLEKPYFEKKYFKNEKTFDKYMQKFLNSFDFNESYKDQFIKENEEFLKKSSYAIDYKNLANEMINDPNVEANTIKDLQKIFFYLSNISPFYENYIENESVSGTLKSNVSFYNKDGKEEITRFILSTENVNEANERLDKESNVRMLYDYNQKLEIERKVKEIEKSLSKKASDNKEYAKLAANWIINNNEYVNRTDSQKPLNSAYAAAFLGESQCHGFATLYTMLLREHGIPAYTITGNVSGEVDKNGKPTVDHSWNLINIDGKWGYVDVTTSVSSGYNEISEPAFFKDFDSKLFAKYKPESIYKNIEKTFGEIKKENNTEKEENKKEDNIEGEKENATEESDSLDINLDFKFENKNDKEEETINEEEYDQEVKDLIKELNDISKDVNFNNIEKTKDKSKIKEENKEENRSPFEKNEEYEQLSEENKKELNLLDTNKNGAIDLDEFKTKYELPVTKDMWIYPFMIDEDGDGIIKEKVVINTSPINENNKKPNNQTQNTSINTSTNSNPQSTVDTKDFIKVNITKINSLTSIEAVDQNGITITFGLLGVENNPHLNEEIMRDDEKEYLKNKLITKEVYLEKDPIIKTQSTQKEDFYLWTELPKIINTQELDNKMINARIIRQGISKYKPSNQSTLKYDIHFKELQTNSEKDKIGVWNNDPNKSFVVTNEKSKTSVKTGIGSILGVAGLGLTAAGALYYSTKKEKNEEE